MCEAVYQGSPKHFSDQCCWMFLTFTSASEGWSYHWLLTYYRLVFPSVQWGTRRSEWECSGIFCKAAIPWPRFPLISELGSSWESSLMMNQGTVIQASCLLERVCLAELPQACLPLVWKKRIRIWYTFLEILPNPDLPRCHHLNAGCRISSESQWI